jgi:hypothetical protein
MKLRPQQRTCLYPSLLLSVAGLALSPVTIAQAQNPNAILQNPEARQALQRLIKKYQAVEQNQRLAQQQLQASAADNQVQATNIASTGAVVPLSTNSGALATDDSQSFDDEAMPSESAELIEGSRFALGDELILGAEIGAEEPRTALADLFAFKTQTSARVGLLALTQILELPITFNADITKADGWLFNENNRFSLSLDQSNQQLTVKAGGQSWQLTENQYQLDADDLYIDLELITQWFGISFQIDESRLKLAISSKRQLPVELRIARRNKDLRPQAVSSESVMPYRETGYKLFTPPLLDAQAGLSHRGDQTTANYSVSGAQDLAYFTGKYYFSGGRADLLNSARLTLARESEKNDLLGPLKATEFEFGDIQPVSGGFGGNRNLGRGLRFSNIPLASSVDGQQVSLVGEVADGWDVELYRNGILLDQELSIDDGRYDFIDVPLEFGINNFEIVFYGPQGQVETRTETYNLDSTSIQKGQVNYQFSLVDVNKSMIPLEEDNFQSSSSRKGLQTNLSSGYGLFDWLSLNAGYGLFRPDNGVEEGSYSVGSNLSLFNLAVLNSNFSETENTSKQTLHDLRTQVLGQSLGFNYRQIKDIRASSSGNERVDDVYAVNMAGQLFRASALPLNYQNEWRRTESMGQRSDVFSNSLGIRTGIGSFSHSLLWQKQPISDENVSPVVLDMFNSEDYAKALLARLELQQQQELEGINSFERTVAGSLQYRNSFNSVFTRLFANYNLKPYSELTSYGMSLSYPLTPDINTNFNLFRYQLTGQTTGNLGLNWRLDDLYLSASASYNSSNGWSGGLNARFGFGVSNEVGYFSSNTQISQSGAITARVFEDKNLNGIKDENEPLIKGAEVKSLQGARKTAVTDSKGTAVLTGLTALQKTDIVVDRASFDDPTMKTLIPGVAITGRKGRMEHIDFAVTSTGELEGTLYVATEQGDMQPAAYAVIQLVNQKGEVVETAQSEFDGYYLFVDVLPGQYKVMIDKSFTNRRNLRISDPIYLGIRGGELINGTDIMLNRKEPASGYAAEIGSFSSLTMLKAYWHLVISSGMNVARLKPFYLQDEASGKYVLRAAFSQDQEKALQVCERLKARTFKCEVNQWTTEL